MSKWTGKNILKLGAMVLQAVLSLWVYYTYAIKARREHKQGLHGKSFLSSLIAILAMGLSYYEAYGTARIIYDPEGAPSASEHYSYLWHTFRRWVRRLFWGDPIETSDIHSEHYEEWMDDTEWMDDPDE
jgi:hypothetical protein